MKVRITTSNIFLSAVGPMRVEAGQVLDLPESDADFLISGHMAEVEDVPAGYVASKFVEEKPSVSAKTAKKK